MNLSAIESMRRDVASKRTLVVGSRIVKERPNWREMFTNAVGIDIEDGPGVDRVINLEEQLPGETFQHVEAVSVLEHARKPWKLAAGIETCLERGGTLFVEAPFVWRVHGYPSDYWRFSIDGVRQLFPSIAWRALGYADESRAKLRGKARSMVTNGQRFLARTEVFGFGMRQ